MKEMEKKMKGGRNMVQSTKYQMEFFLFGIFPGLSVQLLVVQI